MTEEDTTLTSGFYIHVCTHMHQPLHGHVHMNTRRPKHSEKVFTQEQYSFFVCKYVSKYVCMYVYLYLKIRSYHVTQSNF